MFLGIARDLPQGRELRSNPRRIWAFVIFRLTQCQSVFLQVENCHAGGRGFESRPVIFMNWVSFAKSVHNPWVDFMDASAGQS
jgi:hypothetical protein